MTQPLPVYPRKFQLVCRSCGSDRVGVINNIDAANDGDGRTDIWGSIDLQCENCREYEEVIQA